jgi:hypothetical protein
LNKFDSKGKKIGYWKVYLDSTATLVKNQTNAYFYGFQYYLNGQNIGSYFKSKPPEKRSLYHGSLSDKGNPQLVDGRFCFYDKFKRKVTEEIYAAGIVICLRSYTYKNGPKDTIPRLFEDIDYTQKYNNQPFTCLLTEHYSDGNSKSWWFRDREKGWRSYKIH